MSEKDLIGALNWRYAVKEFDAGRPLEVGKLDRLLEALRLSASSFGLQPWNFVVVEDREKREGLVEHSWNQRQVADAPALIVLCRPTSFGEAEVDRFIADTAKTRGVEVETLGMYTGMMKGFLAKLSEEELREWMEKQIYLALGNLLTACAVEGVDSCPMEGFDAGKYDEILGLGERGLASVVLCPVGYRNGGEDKYSSLAKVRHPLEEVVTRLG